MIGLDYTYDEEHVVFTAKTPSPGFFGRMLRTSPPSPDIDGWAAGDAGRCDGLGALRQYGETHAESVRIETDRLVATHTAVAALTAGQARSLGTVQGVPHTHLGPRRAGSSGRRASSCMHVGSTQVAPPSPAGAAHSSKPRKVVFLIRDPQFSLAELADAFEAGSVDLPDHWDALARFRLSP